MTRREEIAWFAGVFEGEGSVYVRKNISGKARNVHIHGGLRIQMTDRDVVERIHAITRVGRIRECKPSGLGKKHSFAWQVQSKEEFEVVAEMLRPFLSKRRLAKLEEVASACTWRDGWWRAQQGEVAQASEEAQAPLK